MRKRVRAAPRATCLGCGHPILSALSGCPECGAGFHDRSMAEREVVAPRATCLGCGHPILSVLTGCPECGGLLVDRRDRRAIALLGQMVFASTFCGLLVLNSTNYIRFGAPGSSTLSVAVLGVGTLAAMSLVGLAIIQEAFIVAQYRSLKLRGRVGWRTTPLLLAILVPLFAIIAPTEPIGIVGSVASLGALVALHWIAWSRRDSLRTLMIRRRRGGFRQSPQPGPWLRFIPRRSLS